MLEYMILLLSVNEITPKPLLHPEILLHTVIITKILQMQTSGKFFLFYRGQQMKS